MASESNPYSVNRLDDKDDQFSKEDIKDFDVKCETAKLDQYLTSPSKSQIRDGWKSASINISVPDGKKHTSEADAPVFPVPDLFYRPIVKVFKAAIRNVGDRCFHYTPVQAVLEVIARQRSSTDLR
ncbi:hypothetical protein MSAN_02367300 [Mycena sanguinolenta]|uniref:Uncharacterized protein n=1 Tax=Mycena sanguinolenta TaxID=230812 RepID=A0A8H6X619_9AGAR|nr:hypothetical protein MSAN_02367300 [Mycena sanguinolenta]